ncbi:MAG: hypothetical protein ACREKI_09080, partial [Gemmatimonadota bacterium]
QELREVIAVGRSVAEAFSEIAERDPWMPKDWVSGDTIVGTFEPKTAGRETANGESSRGVELRLLVATGDARALHHVRDDSRPDGPPAIHYVRGRVVRIVFRDGEVREAQVEGPSTGVYAEPRRAAPDSVVVDSLAPPPETLPPRPDPRPPSPRR